MIGPVFISAAVLLLAVFSAWKPHGAYFGPATPALHHGTTADAYAFAVSIPNSRVIPISTNEVYSSMGSNIALGDLVIAVPRSYTGLHRWDIALRTGIVGAHLVVHRLTRLTRDGWITEGDANLAPDPLMGPAMYQGFVITDTFRP